MSTRINGVNVTVFPYLNVASEIFVGGKELETEVGAAINVKDPYTNLTNVSFERLFLAGVEVFGEGGDIPANFIGTRLTAANITQQLAHVGLEVTGIAEVPLWDGSNPVLFAQGDAVQTGAATLFAIGTDLAKLTKDRAIIGNRGFDTGGADAGAAHVFTKTGSTWTLEQTLQRSGVAAGDQYGNAVTINGDGTRLVACASGNIVSQNGVEVWSRSGTTWSRVQEISTTYSSGTLTDYCELSSDGDFLLLRNNSSIGIIEGWRWNGAAYAFEFDFVEPSNSNSFAEGFWISEDGRFVGASRSGSGQFLVWENTTGSTWVERPAGTGVGNSTVPNDGFGLSGDGDIVSIATTASSAVNTWEWNGAAYVQISVNLPLSSAQAARMSTSGFQIAGGLGGDGNTANTAIFEGSGDVPYVLSSTQVPDVPEKSGNSWTISYDGTMILVGNREWQDSNTNQGRFFSLEV